MIISHQNSARSPRVMKINDSQGNFDEKCPKFFKGKLVLADKTAEVR